MDLEEITADTGYAAQLSRTNGGDYFTISGVAIGEDEVTRHEDGEKYWPAEALKAATESLVGVQLTKNHNHDKVEGIIGEITDTLYKDGVGILFEAKVRNEEVARKIHDGLLEVSVHALHANGGWTEDGAMIVEAIKFQDLSVVPRGAAASNEVRVGSMEPATLSADSIEEMVGDEFETAAQDNETELEDDEVELDEDCDTESQESTEASDDGELRQSSSAECDTSQNSDSMTDEDSTEDSTDDVDVEALQERVATLEEQNEALASEVESVRMEYADALCGDSAFSAEELADKFTVEELAEKYEDADVEVAEASAPDPQTGAVEEEEVEASEETEQDEEIAQLEAQIEQYDSMGWDGARKEAEATLSELRNEDAE